MAKRIICSRNLLLGRRRILSRMTAAGSASAEERDPWQGCVRAKHGIK